MYANESICRWFSRARPINERITGVVRRSKELRLNQLIEFRHVTRQAAIRRPIRWLRFRKFQEKSNATDTQQNRIQLPNSWVDSCQIPARIFLELLLELLLAKIESWQSTWNWQLKLQRIARTRHIQIPSVSFSLLNFSTQKFINYYFFFDFIIIIIIIFFFFFFFFLVSLFQIVNCCCNFLMKSDAVGNWLAPATGTIWTGRYSTFIHQNDLNGRAARIRVYPIM